MMTRLAGRQVVRYGTGGRRVCVRRGFVYGGEGCYRLWPGDTRSAVRGVRATHIISGRASSGMGEQRFARGSGTNELPSF